MRSVVFLFIRLPAGAGMYFYYCFSMNIILATWFFMIHCELSSNSQSSWKWNNKGKACVQANVNANKTKNATEIQSKWWKMSLIQWNVGFFLIASANRTFGQWFVYEITFDTWWSKMLMVFFCTSPCNWNVNNNNGIKNASIRLLPVFRLLFVHFSLYSVVFSPFLCLLIFTLPHPFGAERLCFLHCHTRFARSYVFSFQSATPFQNTIFHCFQFFAKFPRGRYMIQFFTEILFSLAFQFTPQINTFARHTYSILFLLMIFIPHWSYSAHYGVGARIQYLGVFHMNFQPNWIFN